MLGPPCSLLHNNEQGGQRYHFLNGHLVSLSNEPPFLSNKSAMAYDKPLALVEPFAVYGEIHTVWDKAGCHRSKYGRPICDEQDLPDGGRCSIFEGGHIHLYNGQAQESVLLIYPPLR